MPFDITFTAVPASGTIDELIADCGFYFLDPTYIGSGGEEVFSSYSVSSSVLT